MTSRRVSACAQCDSQDVELPTVYAAARDFHRAAHDLWRVAVEPWALPVVAWLNRRLTKRA